MKSLLAIVLLVTTAASALNLTEFEREQARLALQNPTLFEGDIMGLDPHMDRNVIPYKQMRWPGGVVPYVIDPNLENKVQGIRNLINRAIQNYHQNTCLRFVPRDSRNSEHRNYIKVIKDQGCYSYIGMIDRGEQPLSLGDGCHFVGTIVHELGHAIGFYHEQSRSDRDTYLRIYWENIQQKMEDQFAKLNPDQNILYNIFDHDSIMLYGNYAFSKDGRSMTMVAKNGKRLLEPYDKSGLTRSDIERVRRMYDCPRVV